MQPLPLRLLLKLKESGCTDGCWIGFEDSAQQGGFLWEDGSSVDFVNWAPAEPNNVVGYRSGGRTGTAVAIDLRGHGRTSPLTDDFTIQKTSEDILKFMYELKLEDIKAIGLSFGGLALLELAVSDPEKIESMILIGVSPSFKGGDNNDDSFSYENLPKPFIQDLKKIHFHGEGQIKALFDANLDYQINLTDQEIEAIDSNCLIVQGDRDEVLGIDAAVELYKKMSHAELWIVPNTGHMALNGPNQDDFLKKSLEFFNRQ